MDWNFNISPAKIEELKRRIAALNIDTGLIEEQFIHGSGRGGQKINKTANCVRMTYPPLGITVKIQKSRQRNQNRFLALRELVDQIEAQVSPATSKRLKEQEKLRRQKDRSRRRTKTKLDGSEPQKET